MRGFTKNKELRCSRIVFSIDNTPVFDCNLYELNAMMQGSFISKMEIPVMSKQCPVKRFFLGG